MPHKDFGHLTGLAFGQSALRHQLRQRRSFRRRIAGNRAQLCRAARPVKVILRPARQELSQPHRHRIGKQVREAKDQNRQPADLRHPLGLRAGKACNDGECRDDPVIAAIGDLFDEILHALAEPMRPVALLCRVMGHRHLRLVRTSSPSPRAPASPARPAATRTPHR